MVAGSNVALTLYFVRFALGLNLLLLAIWAVCTVGPFFLQRPSTFRSNQISAYSARSILQGYGLDNTWFLYGAPSTKCRDGSRTPMHEPPSMTVSGQ